MTTGTSPREKLIALPPGSNDGSALDQHLPEPRGEGRPNPMGGDPGQDAQLLEQRRLADERGRKLRDEREAQRKAYQDALKRHGLTDPNLGYPGSNPGGLGY